MLLHRVHCVLPARRLAWRRLAFRDPQRRNSSGASSPLWRVYSSSSASPSTTTTAANSHAICSSSSSSSSSSEQAIPPPPAKLVKRKLALHIGYVGTNYRGLQWQPPSQTAAAEVAAGGGASYRPPVENVLERALALSGAITAANSGNPAKVGWTRSSRTDAGVHSVSTVVSLRAECSPTNFEQGNDPEGIEFAAAVNALLPRDVRVFSAQRVNGGWCARGMCESREYEYTLPAWILLPSSSSSGGKPGEKGAEGEGDEEAVAASLASAVERLEGVLGLYLGQHPFHNFTVRREYRPQGSDGKTGVGRRRRDPQGADRRERLGWKEGEGGGGGGDSSSSSSSFSSSSAFAAAPSISSSSSSFTAAGSFGSKNQQQSRSVSSTTTTATTTTISSGEEDEEQEQRPLLVKPLWLEQASGDDSGDKIGPAHWRRIDSARVVHRLLPLVPGGVMAITVRISGGSFMLRQLRHMIGAAVAVARGSLPSADVVAASLRVPARISLPLAPPHTLVLTSARFGAYPEKALAKGERPPWTGDRLELREEGRKKVDEFREGPLGEALDNLLSHEDWTLWAGQLDRLAWDDGEVATFVSRAKEDERLAKERRRERELERAAKEKEEQQRETVDA